LKKIILSPAIVRKSLIKMGADNLSSKRKRKLYRSNEPEAHESKNSFPYGGSYHRFFEGYCEETAPGKNGKRKKISRIYIANYFRRDCSDFTWHLIKASYVLLYLAAVAVYIFAMTRGLGSNAVWYAAVPGLLSVLPLMLLFAKIVACVAAKRKMVVYEYKYVFNRVFVYCATASAFVCATALMKLLCILLSPQARMLQEFMSCLGCFLSAGALLCIGIIERRADYVCIENPNTPTDEGVII
jgi:hypothetical protein